MLQQETESGRCHDECLLHFLMYSVYHNSHNASVKTCLDCVACFVVPPGGGAGEGARGGGAPPLVKVRG